MTGALSRETSMIS